MIYIKLAVRNVHKNLRSVWLSGAGIALTVIAIIFILSLSRSIMNQIVWRNIQFETGAVTIRIPKELGRYENKPAGDEIYADLLAALRETPQVTGHRPRITAHNAMLYAADKSLRTRVVGLSPEEHPLLLDAIHLTAGTANWDETPNGILLSQGLAAESGLEIGSDCYIVLQSADGTVNMQDYTVTGLFLDTSQANKSIVYTSFTQAKSLYHSNLPTEVLVDIANLPEAENVQQHLRHEIRHPWIEVEAYTEHISSAQALSGINKYSLSGMAFFLLFISFVGIWAMQVENINERRREIGTLLTFGFKRLEVKRIFLFESAYISLLSLGVGLVIILPLLYIINVREGVYLGASASFAFGSSILRPEAALSDVFLAALVAVGYPLLATGLSLLAINKMRIVKLIALCGIIATLPAKATDPDYLALSDQALYVEYADVRMEVLKNGKIIKEYEMELYRKAEKIRMEFTAPATEKGRRMLNDESNMWMYMPRTSKVIKLPLKQAFMGSDASNRDLMRLAFAKDYDLVGMEDAGTGMLQLELKAKDLSVSYNKVVIRFDKKGNVPVQQEMYALSGKLIKTITYIYEEQTDGTRSISEMHIKDELLQHSLTKMQYKNCKRRHEKSDIFYTLGSLKQ